MAQKELGLGKVFGETLRRCVLSYVPLYHKPSLDAVITQIRGNLAISHNPAIGLPLETLGFFAFHYATSNVAVRFARPKYIAVGINLPLRSTESDLATISERLGVEAKCYDVKILAGHTGVYKGLDMPIVSVTCIGRVIKKPERISRGDSIIMMGEAGAEAVWLESVTRGGPRTQNSWRKLTPLPLSLSLINIRGVKLMHDVSEGGIAGALYEIAEKINFRLKINSGSICYHASTKKLNDPLRLPSYGVLLAIISNNILEKVSKISRELGYEFSKIGEVEKGHGSYIDGIRIKGIQRTKFDEIYGELPERDDILRRLTENLAHLESNTEISSLIPAVGMNMVYSRPRARSLNEVAGVSGKVIVSSGKPKVCGNVSYGGSKHVALALLEAMKLNPRIRAAINIAGTGEALEALESVGIKICHVPSTEMGECPIATFIKDSGTYYQAYYHPGAFAIEPSVVLFSKTPEGLLRTLTRVAKHVRDKKGL